MSLGCDQAQGYWLARPGPADDVPAAVAALQERLVAPPGSTWTQSALPA